MTEHEWIAMCRGDKLLPQRRRLMKKMLAVGAVDAHTELAGMTWPGWGADVAVKAKCQCGGWVFHKPEDLNDEAAIVAEVSRLMFVECPNMIPCD